MWIDLPESQLWAAEALFVKELQDADRFCCTQSKGKELLNQEKLKYIVSKNVSFMMILLCFYILYLLWQKELRELAAGVYNVLQASVGNPRSVHELYHNVNV